SIMLRIKPPSAIFDGFGQFNQSLYQFSQCLTDVCPVATSDGEDFPWLGDEGIPGVAAVIENVVEGFENAVREPVLAHELPDVFLRVELRRTRRQRQERDILRHLESFRAMPSGP